MYRVLLRKRTEVPTRIIDNLKYEVRGCGNRQKRMVPEARALGPKTGSNPSSAY